MSEVEIVKTEGTLGGKARVAGTRVSVEQIVEMHEIRGLSPAEIADRLPTLSEDGAETALKWAEENTIDKTGPLV